MSANLFCQIHGPYSAKDGSCPFCAQGAGGRPAAPTPLEEDNLPTDIGFSPYQYGAQGGVDDDAKTQPPSGGSGIGFLNSDEDPTIIHSTRNDNDRTELYHSGKAETAKGILWVKEDTEGRKRGRIYHLKDETVIGRKAGDIVLDDRYVSDPHAKLLFKEGHFVIGDLMTSNGTFVNGEQIQQQTVLKENDIIKIGTTVLVLKVLD